MDAPQRDTFRPRFLVEAALVGLLLWPLVVVGPWPTTELEVTRYVLILILYGWLGRRIARRAGAPGEAAGAGALAGAVAALIVSGVQLGAAASVTRELVPEPSVPAVLGASVVIAALGGAIFGAVASAVGFLVFRSETSDTNLRRLFAGLLRLRWYVGDPVETAGDMAMADLIEEDTDEEEARRAGKRVSGGRRAKQRPSAWETWIIRVSFFLMAVVGLLIVVISIGLCSAAAI